MSEGRNNGLLIVIAGPPLSGKSSLSRNLLSSVGIGRKLVGASVDEVKTALMSGESTSMAERDAAYGVVHLFAELSLRQGVSVILEATYARRNPRLELTKRVKGRVDGLVLIQCSVDPHEAERRLARRGGGHPAVDLTPALVRGYALSYDFCPTGLVLDSTHLSENEMAMNALDAVRASALVRLEEWSSGGGSNENQMNGTH